MPVQLLNIGKGKSETLLPRHLQKEDLKHLREGFDHTNKYFQGIVALSYPLTKLGDGTDFFKVVLQGLDNLCSRTNSINILIHGKMAEDCAKIIHHGDTFIVAGYKLAKSPTAGLDGRHGCHLELSEEAGSAIYIYGKPRTTAAPETASLSVAPKYVYTPLNHLKDGTIVNLYGVVKFFKPPYVSKGTDYCSVVTLVDPSNVKLTCTLFNGNLDSLPKIYKVGDIVRFHRIKIREYNGQMQGITGVGFASLTFDGTVGAPVVPRSSSKVYTFMDEEQKTIEELRVWAASNLSISGPAAKLSGVRPMLYFDLTCQLVGKAKVDGSSFLLKVWDGTKCPYPTWKVPVEARDLEGEKVVLHQLRNLTVDVLVYDNHVQLAKSLKIGSFLRIYSIHTKQASAVDEDVSHIEFHLHGGTCYGRGIGVLPESNLDVKELKAFLESVDLADSQSTESMSSVELDSTFNNVTDLESYLQRCQQLPVTVLTDHQDLNNTELKTILNSTAPQQYRIRAKLRTYKPQKLYQSIKLHCSKCNSLQEVPDGDDFDFILQGSAVTAPNPELHNTSWYDSVMWTTQDQKQRKIAIHFVKHDEMLQQPEDTLLMIEGGTLKELWKLTKRFKCVIPVRSTEDDLELLDPSAPFLLQGNIKYYGCKQCSTPKPIKSLSSIAAEQQPSWEPTEIAQVLGIVPLQYVFIMKFTLVDATGALNVYLFDYENFFQIPASEILTNNSLQQKMQMTMNTLCPPGRKLDDLPWLECFIKSYNVRDTMTHQVYYQIFDTTVAEGVV
ncbi:protection of telomeres protein 1 isoform X2 [Accipiter gentilis]|uniref:protection of telomeres protein 1 isoform X2 n=1 Tax=Astur gentilis TaxID=8957 RepID=UPI0021100E8C|nr:protection of telomeres protein 1 isoform X2 [Accipiter gentilis]XP_049669867.1 protection of telomeres protein 1 isoform X2 [Accipiter gentilis]XP_049669868.1 protection of telomeres protein 1 isoform X2 [Accipiter gentilis]XP_049669869.1 protection of telomeres protein 1 isoform X2 [Accipiter gentilis]XP_049669870.1 protection of telomeres protein 1 isoform X2 [Accipiter gentilis]